MLNGPCGAGAAILAAAWLFGVAASEPQGTTSPAIHNVFLARGDVMPSASRRALPVLPPTDVLTADREEIDIEVVVGQRGDLRHARVAGSNPARAAREQAAIAAVQQWQFRAAATGDGRPLITLAVVRFTLERARRAGEAPRVRAQLVAPSRDVLPPADLPDGLYTCLPGNRPKQLRDPVVIRGIVPSYDPSAMRAMTQGSVTIDIVVLPDGTVGNARVTKSLDQGLDREALIAARHWFFQPGMLDGQPVACRTTLVLDFRLP